MSVVCGGPNSSEAQVDKLPASILLTCALSDSLSKLRTEDKLRRNRMPLKGALLTLPESWCLFVSDGSCVVKARVLTCVEGMNLPLLEQAIREQRLYQQERDSGQ